MNDEKKYEDLEAPSDEVLDITVRGRTSKYRFLDISSANMQDAVNKMNVPDKAKAADARRAFQARIISMGVRRVDPPNGKDEKISMDEALAFGSALAMTLQKAAMKFNGIDPDAKDEETIKND